MILAHKYNEMCFVVATTFFFRSPSQPETIYIFGLCIYKWMDRYGMKSLGYAERK